MRSVVIAICTFGIVLAMKEKWNAATAMLLVAGVVAFVDLVTEKR